MKKTILFFALITTLFVYSQDFEGLGIFKLGKFTVSKLDSLSKSNKYQLKECDSYDCTNNSNLIELKPNKTATFKSPTYTSYSDNVKVFQLNKFILNGLCI